MDLHVKPEDCSHGYSDLPNVNLPTQINTEIEVVPLAEKIMTCSEDKGEVTHCQGILRLQQSSSHNDVIFPVVRNQAIRVDVVTPKTELSEIHPKFQDDNSSVFRKCKLDPETQSVISCPEPSSVRDDINHLRHLPRDIVKQEVLDADDRKVLQACYVKEQNMDYSVLSCEDRKPVLHLPSPTANSASLQTQCLMERHDSSTSPGLMPVAVGLYYNTVHHRHLIKSQDTESNNAADNTAEMEPELPVCDRQREFLYARGRVDNRGQTNVNDPVCCPVRDLFSDHELPVCDKELLHVRDSGDHRGQSVVNNPVNDQSIPNPIHNGGKPHTCKLCNKTLSRLVALQQHKLAHTRGKPFTCNICKKTFALLSTLKKHEQRQTGEYPYSCKICNKACSQLGHLKQHERTHTGEKPYSCNICNMEFSQTSTLKQHERTHTGEKSFSCNICKKRFSRSSNLIPHKRTHTVEKPYSCSICNKAFSMLCKLKNHEQTHTGK